MYRDSVENQKKHGICRNNIGEFETVYKGVIGGSITKEAYEYCKDYVKKHPEYLEDIKFTRLPSEFFFHTILFNTEYFKNKLCGDIRGGKHDWIWDNKKNMYAHVDLKDYEKIKENKKVFFIRGIKSDNKELVNRILKDIKAPYRLE